jgi:hypothetical protein
MRLTSLALLLSAVACKSSSPSSSIDAGNGIADAPIATADAPSSTPDARGPDAATSFQYQGANGQDRTNYTFTFDHAANTFVVTNTSALYTLSGPVVALPSGFLKITFIAGCNGAGCTPSSVNSTIDTQNGGTVTLPFTAHALEADGFIALVLTDVTQVGIGGVGQSDCVNGMLASYNVMAFNQQPGDDISTGFAYSQATIGGTTTAPTSMGNAFSLYSDAGTPFPSLSGTCSAGIMEFAGGEVDGGIQVYESGAKGVILFNNPDDLGNQTGIGLKQTPITLADLENHNYAAFTFIHGASAGPAYGELSIGASPSGVGKPFADVAAVDSNTLSTDTTMWSVVNFDGIDNGLFHGTITSTGIDVNLKGAAIKAGGKNIIIGEGASATDGTQIMDIYAISL